MKFPAVTVLDPAALFANGSGRYRVAKDGRPLYFDSDHVNLAGTMMLRPLFEPIFGGAGTNPATIQKTGTGNEAVAYEKSRRF